MTQQEDQVKNDLIINLGLKVKNMTFVCFQWVFLLNWSQIFIEPPIPIGVAGIRPTGVS